RRPTKPYITVRQVQKLSSAPASVPCPTRSVSPAMARWKAWLCRFGIPGIIGPDSHSASPCAVSGLTDEMVPAESTSMVTLRAQPSGSSALSAWNWREIMRASGLASGECDTTICCNAPQPRQIGSSMKIDTPWDIVYRNARLATMRLNGQPYGAIEDGAIALKDGRIAWVGPQAELPASPPEAP